MEQQLSYVGIEEAARRLGVPFWRIRHAHRAGHVEEPPRVSNRRVYDAEMLDKLRAYFRARKDAVTPTSKGQIAPRSFDALDFLLRWNPVTAATMKDVAESCRVAKVIKAIPMQCWLNARRVVLKLDDYADASLVEGWSLIGGKVPIEHAWVVRDGVIIDPTLPELHLVYFAGLEFRGRAEIEQFLSTPEGKKCKRTACFYAFGWAGMQSPHFRKCYDDMMGYLDAEK